MKVIKATGLVPVKALKSLGNMSAGQVFGVKPDQARVGVADGDVELHPVPEGVETYEVNDPPPVDNTTPVPADKPIEIPDGWKEIHHLKRILLAQDIAGHKIELTPTDQAAGTKMSDVANDIIEAEIQRRAAAATPPA